MDSVKKTIKKCPISNIDNLCSRGKTSGFLLKSTKLMKNKVLEVLAISVMYWSSSGALFQPQAGMNSFQSKGSDGKLEY